jgi:hypothetical protein
MCAKSVSVDQPLPRVFVSSVITGFEPYRTAAADGIEGVAAEPVLIERFPSLDVSSRTACLDAIDTCDAVVVVIGPRPGFITPSGKYVVEEEWQHARKRAIPVFVFVQDGKLEPDSERIAKEISEYVNGRFRRTFANPQELRSEVEASLNGILKRPAQMDTNRLEKFLSQRLQGGYEPIVRLAIQPIREGEMIDPLHLDAQEFQDAILQLGTERPSPLFSLRAKKNVNAGTSHVQFEQPDRSGRDPDQWFATAQVFTDGLLVAERAAASPAGASGALSLGLTLTASELTNATASLFQFAEKIYRHLDPYLSYRDMIYGVTLVNLGMRYIYDVAPDQGRGMPVRTSDNSNILAFDKPRPIVREALEHPSEEINRAVSLIRRRSQQGV